MNEFLNDDDHNNDSNVLSIMTQEHSDRAAVAQ